VNNRLIFFLSTYATILLLLVDGCDARKSTFLTTPHARQVLNVPHGGGQKIPLEQVKGRAPVKVEKLSKAQTEAKTNVALAATGGEIELGEIFEIGDFCIASILKGRLSASSVAKGFSERLLSARRFYYLISFVLSAFYGYKFLQPESESVPCDFYKDGFCVTGLENKVKCPGPNSHRWAWHEDIIFTILSIVIPYTKFADDNLSTATKIAIPAIIFGHGVLHGWIDSKDCNIPTDLEKIGTVFYATFVGVLTTIMFFLFSDLPEKRPTGAILLEVAGITALIVLTSLDKIKDGDAIAVFFLVSQLLIGYLGAFHPGDLATKIVGQTFIAPCIVSLLEFLKCDWLHKVGGHAWYDFFLHISIISSFLPADVEELKSKVAD